MKDVPKLAFEGGFKFKMKDMPKLHLKEAKSQSKGVIQVVFEGGQESIEGC